jgi:hypothetical protein
LELAGLGDVGIEGIDLRYHESRKVDENGNQLRYRARIYVKPHATVGKWAVDVILSTTNQGLPGKR